VETEDSLQAFHNMSFTLEPDVELEKKRQELALAIKRRDERAEIKLCGEIACLLTSLQEFEEAWSFHERYAEAWVDQAEASEYLHQQKALARIVKEGNFNEEARVYLKLGHLFHRTGALLMALEHGEKALHIQKVEGDLRAQAACYELLATIFEGLGRIDDAVMSQEGILAYAQAAGDQIMTQRSLAALGQLRNNRDPGSGREAMERYQEMRRQEDGLGFTGPARGRSFVFKSGKSWN